MRVHDVTKYVDSFQLIPIGLLALPAALFFANWSSLRLDANALSRSLYDPLKLMRAAPTVFPCSRR